MGRIEDGLLDYFNAEGIHYYRTTRSPHILLHVEAVRCNVVCILEARSAQEQVIVRALLPIHVPLPRISVAEEYIARANLGLAIGNFELDRNRGLMAYKTSLDIEGTPFVPGLIGHLLDHAVEAIDRHLTGLILVTFGSVSPLEALEQMERYPLDVVIDLANDELD